MKIDKVIEVADGTVTFNGELSPGEVELVVHYGLNTMLALGVLKPQVVHESPEEAEAKDNTLQ